jgi:DNA-binding winged helix-turn-helix (wHTH) protein
MLSITTRTMPTRGIVPTVVRTMRAQFEGRPRSFAFGPFVLQPERQLLLKDGEPVRIGGRALDILIALVERPGVLISKQELLARAWPNVCVEEGNLKTNVAQLRRVLLDRSEAPEFIATTVGRGYRFVAAVRGQ